VIHRFRWVLEPDELGGIAGLSAERNEEETHSGVGKKWNG
jgi:hypothetical protein